MLVTHVARSRIEWWNPRRSGCIEPVVRRPIALTLVLALLLALVAPAQAAWSCPDGTPCVHDQQQGYVCAGNKCAAQASSCCVVKTTRCKHGAAPARDGGRSRRSQLQAPDHCRFSVSSPPQLTVVAETAKLLWVGLDVALPSSAFRLSLSPAQPVWRSEFTLGYRPPPILSSAPSRAPPVA